MFSFKTRKSKEISCEHHEENFFSRIFIFILKLMFAFEQLKMDAGRNDAGGSKEMFHFIVTKSLKTISLQIST